MTDYFIRFVNHLDPNGGTLFNWPKYHPEAPQLLTLLDGPTPMTITNDTFRQDAMAFLMQLALKYPV